MNFLERIKNILLQPNNCWNEISKEKGIGGAVKYLLTLLPISAFLYFIFSIIFLNFVDPAETIEFAKIFDTLGLSITIGFLIITILLFIFLFACTFINSFIIYIFMKLFKIRGNFTDTYKSFTYSATPQLLLMGIPYVNNISYFYMSYLQIIGLSRLHKISIWKSVGILLLAYTLLLLIIFVPIFIFIMSMIPLS